jgi:hypothetical protein
VVHEPGLFNRRVAQRNILCAALRLTLCNSAVKQNQVNRSAPGIQERTARTYLKIIPDAEIIKNTASFREISGGLTRKPGKTGQFFIRGCLISAVIGEICRRKTADWGSFMGNRGEVSGLQGVWLYILDYYSVGLFICKGFNINFPAKQHWKSPSQLVFITDGLSDLRRILIELDIRSVALPQRFIGLTEEFIRQPSNCIIFLFLFRYE